MDSSMHDIAAPTNLNQSFPCQLTLSTIYHFVILFYFSSYDMLSAYDDLKFNIATCSAPLVSIILTWVDPRFHNQLRSIWYVVFISKLLLNYACQSMSTWLPTWFCFHWWWYALWRPSRCSQSSLPSHAKINLFQSSSAQLPHTLL